jgi:hypothetical protein
MERMKFIFAARPVRLSTIANASIPGRGKKSACNFAIYRFLAASGFIGHGDAAASSV